MEFEKENDKLSFSLLMRFLSWFFFGPRHVACGILVPQLGIEPHPLSWKHTILITGPPGKSLDEIFKLKEIQKKMENHFLRTMRYLCSSVKRRLPVR